MKRLIPVIALAIVLASSSVWAADATLGLDMNSAYVWRGITFNDGPVAQPSIDVTNGSFGVNVWANWDIDDYDDQLDDNEFSEVDLTVYYGFSLQKLEIGVGVIEYLFPVAGGSTHEAYVSLGLPIVGGLSVGSTFYYDFDEIDGYYVDLGLTYAMDLTDAFSIEAGARAAYADDDFAMAYSGTDGGLYDYTLSLSASYTLTEAWSVSASINYADSLDDDALADAEDGTGVDVNLYGGISVAYAF